MGAKFRSDFFDFDPKNRKTEIGIPMPRKKTEIRIPVPKMAGNRKSENGNRKSEIGSIPGL